MLLSADEHLVVGRFPSFLFDVFLQDGSDSYIIPGDGVDDLDHVLSVFDNFPPPIVKCDIHPADGTSFKDVDFEDVTEIRRIFVETYGEVNKPDVYAYSDGVAF